MSTILKSGLLVVLVFFVGGVGYGVGWMHASDISAQRLDRVVAISWESRPQRTSEYGAHVYLQPRGHGYSVRAQVFIHRGDEMFHDCGELGTAATDDEAVARWGMIEWREDGLHIGRGADAYFLSRATMAEHR